MRVAVLGPLHLHRAGGFDVTPTGALQRRLLAALVLWRGAAVSSERLIDVLWPHRPPRDAVGALQTHMYRLRGLLPAGAVEHTSTGYRLGDAVVDVDADWLAEAVARAVGTSGVDPATTLRVLDEAMAAWRGPAYPELSDTGDGRAEASRLEDLRLRAAELRLQALLDIGRAAEAVTPAAELVEQAPLRERPRAMFMSALAATGRRVDALRSYDDFRRRLGEELGIEPSPALAAQHAGLLTGQQLQARSGGDVPPSPLRPAPAPVPAPVALPVPATSFVGRDELVAEVVALAEAQRLRLVTLLGPGGVGKTRVLLEVGVRLQHRRPDRPVVLCELAGASNATALDVVATTLGEPRADKVDAPGRLAAALGGRELVLLLDNCEHVLDSLALFAERVLSIASGVTLLATSRERLRVDGEQVLAVPPLPIPDAGADTAAPAVQLLVDRARAVRPGFAPRGDELVRVAEIARRLDGLPLAIELAAARLQTMEVDEVAAGLDRRLHLLTTGVRTSDRHRSLAAAMAWSYEVLSPDLRRTFADLSVFAGSFTAADAAAVLGVQRHRVVASLAELAERSLVIRTPGGRYALLETLRAFAALQLSRAGRSDHLAARHAAHFLAWVEDADQRLRHPSSPGVLDEIDAGLPDLRESVTWFVDHDVLDGAGRFVVALQRYAFMRVRPEALGWADRVRALDSAGAHPITASVWAVHALAAWQEGDLVEAGRRAAQALELVPEDREPPMSVLQLQGSLALFEGRLGEGVGWWERARKAAHGDGFDGSLAEAAAILCLAYGHDPSVHERARSLVASVEGHESAVASFAWYAAGEAELHHDPLLARQRLATALEVAAATGCTFVTGIAGQSAASLDARIGDPSRAAAWYRDLLLHWRRQGMWSTQWTMLRSIAVLLERLGQRREAAVILAAVTSTRAGHRLFGSDAETLAELDAALRESLDEADHRAALTHGAQLDGEAAVDFALDALDAS